MSIETLLEAAKFLELQAQQQQRAREEIEWREKLHFEQLVDHRRSDVTYTSPIRVGHVARGEEPHAERRPTPVPPPPLPPPSMPMTVIPVPMVTSNHTELTPPPASTLPPLATPPHPSPRRDHPSPQDQGAPSVKPSLSPSAGSGNHKQQHHHQQQQQQHPPHPLVLSQSGNPRVQQQPVQLVQPYSMVTTPQHATLLPQPGPLKPPQPGPLKHPQPALQTSPVCRGSPPEDGRHQDRKRPGGAGTREVHNKLEKNRRAHLKECFDTLKKNIPNVDEKKSSNLSVLRSALRYIQTLKRKEKEYEHEMERLAREKISTQQRLSELKKELSQWMDVMDVERALRQTVQPEEEDQASTSTFGCVSLRAAEGEEDPALEEPRVPPAAPKTSVAAAIQPELRKTLLPPAATATSLLPPHISVQHHPHIQPHPPAALSGVTATPVHQALLPAPSPMATGLQPTVITAHASATHASVIQAVSHVIQTSGGPRQQQQHVAQLAPGGPHQPIGHITVLGPRLPTLYPTQQVTVGHITHTLTQGQVKGLAGPGQAAGATALVVGGKQSVPQVMTHHHHHHHHHQQLVSQTVLNPVTMVTMPSFPVGTLKLA
ncbi:max-binding protein MNT-like [Aplochiton taeniatus]